MVDKKILEIVVCPVCKEKLEYKNDPEKFVCNKCKKAYPIRDGLAILIKEEAEDI